ncbi:retinol dehydrogenase 12 [Plutella xylostella]|uniref:retinol dehydrogenase 12 n=1 Tax=Plutella xylostella TaxID=51655 RepID=UPI002032BE25|nr:retinol dehydrogenase 12 [Plutella xylostella]XP_037964445.2 retinol dehydrogenase 12 [Plutella xylostella]
MDYISGWCRSKRRLDGVTAVVTGSNTGIGKETVREFYKRGARVIMACRSVEKAEDARKEIISEFLSNARSEEKPGSIAVEQLDLTSLASVRAFAARVLENEPELSILVNNAGVMMCPEGRTEDGFETHMGTNHFAHALLTLLLLPRLKRNAPARVVCVSSYLHQTYELDLNDMNFENTKYDALKAYCWSKAANVLFAKALARKLKEHGIDNVTTYSLHPGVIRTEISRHFSTTFLKGATWAFNNLMAWFVKSPRCGAQTSIYCAIDEACADQSGLYYQDCAAYPTSKQCRKDEVADEFWLKTVAALKLGSYNAFGDDDPTDDILKLN